MTARVVPVCARRVFRPAACKPKMVSQRSARSPRSAGNERRAIEYAIDIERTAHELHRSQRLLIGGRVFSLTRAPLGTPAIRELHMVYAARHKLRPRPRGRAAALRQKTVEIHIGHGHVAREQVGLGKQTTVFRDEVLAYKHQVRG